MFPNKHMSILVTITNATLTNYNIKSQLGSIHYLNINIICTRSSKSTVISTYPAKGKNNSLCEAIPRSKNLTAQIKAISNKNLKYTIFTDSQTSLHQVRTRYISKIKNKIYGIKVLGISGEIEKHSVYLSNISIHKTTFLIFLQNHYQLKFLLS